MSHGVLVIEDEPVLGRNIATYLSREGFDVRVAGTGEEGLAAFAERRCEVVLVDYQLPGIDGLEVLRALKARDAAVRVVLMTGSGDEDTVLSAFRSGAADYLKKPLQLAGLHRVVAGQVDGLRLQRPEAPDASSDPMPEFVGESAAVRNLRTLMRRVIDAGRRATPGRAPSVLVTGETGAGKELVARALHDAWGGGRPLVELNCAAMPASMVESELFGHERGAFTDAREARAGLIESAADGTLFLDEVGCLDLASQAKLLRVLEERRVRRLGGTQAKEFHAHIVAATSADLDQMVRAGSFRADLYYRLGMLRLRIPALREREDDTMLLAGHFLRQFAGRYGKPRARLSLEAVAAIRRHAWPGNVRELRNAIEQAVVICEGEAIHADELGIAPAPVHAPALPDDAQLLPQLTDAERELLARALKESGANVSKAARMLGVSRDTLRYRMRKHGLAH